MFSVSIVHRVCGSLAKAKKRVFKRFCLCIPALRSRTEFPQSQNSSSIRLGTSEKTDVQLTA